MSWVLKVLKTGVARENIVLKIQFEINKSEKKGIFFLKIINVASNIQKLNEPRLGPDTGTNVFL